jgi:hypothetical protein
VDLKEFYHWNSKQNDSIPEITVLSLERTKRRVGYLVFAYPNLGKPLRGAAAVRCLQALAKSKNRTEQNRKGKWLVEEA